MDTYRRNCTGHALSMGERDVSVVSRASRTNISIRTHFLWKETQGGRGRKKNVHSVARIPYLDGRCFFQHLSPGANIRPLLRPHPPPLGFVVKLEYLVVITAAGREKNER
jgi:hypothetical protein